MKFGDLESLSKDLSSSYQEQPVKNKLCIYTHVQGQRNLRVCIHVHVHSQGCSDLLLVIHVIMTYTCNLTSQLCFFLGCETVIVYQYPNPPRCPPPKAILYAVKCVSLSRLYLNEESVREKERYEAREREEVVRK